MSTRAPCRVAYRTEGASVRLVQPFTRSSIIEALPRDCRSEAPLRRGRVEVPDGGGAHEIAGGTAARELVARRVHRACAVHHVQVEIREVRERARVGLDAD